MLLVKPLTAAITSFADGRITEFFARHVSLMRSTSTSTPAQPEQTAQEYDDGPILSVLTVAGALITTLAVAAFI
mgnify:FL=1